MWKDITNKVFSKGNKSNERAGEQKQNESSSDIQGVANKTEEKCVSSHMMAEGETSLIGQNNLSSSKAKRIMKTSTRSKCSGHKKVVIQNLTEKILVLKEMIRGVNGPVRYVIRANEPIVIKLGGQNTYYRLLVYAISEVVDGSSSSTSTHATPTPSTPQGPHKFTKTPVDTGLTIDSDFLSDANLIFISWDQSNCYIISTE